MNLQEIHTSLKNGDNKALEHIYLEHGDYCIKMLTSKKGCIKEEAEDLFIESVMIFREKVMGGAIQQLTNTRYYLYKTCENVYLARLKSERGKKRKVSDVEHFFYANDHIDIDDEYNLKLRDAASKAWEELTEKCKDILYYFYVDSLRMAEIMELMKISSVDVTKTTKSRCYKKLMTTARIYYNQAI